MKYILLMFLLGMVACPLSAQIRFFRGSYEQAVNKAREENKGLFVDFWAEWCAPCKMMEKRVFTDTVLGEYFNTRFICVQLDAEDVANKAVVKRYKIESLPTLVFISHEDKELRRVVGFSPPEKLLHEAKIALGEELSFEQLYEKYRKNRKDFDVLQQLLFEAPSFMMTQQGYNQEKWNARVESLFPDYLKGKKLENMINGPDFYILTMYHSQTSKDDPVFDFMVKHYDRYVQVLDTAMVAQYLIGLNNSYIIRLCKQGNPAYKECIRDMSGKLQKIYAGFSFGSLTVQEAVTLLADATYFLYKHDLNRFFDNLNRYFAGKGNAVTLNDYLQPLQDLAGIYGGEMPDEVYPHCIPWIDKALQFEEGMTAELRTRLLIVLGQCLQNTGEQAKAKQCLNQAFMESARISDPRLMLESQQLIKQMLNE